METKTIECDKCCGEGSYIEQFEPIPGIHQEMGVSIKERIKCKSCQGEGRIPVPNDYESCGECGFDHCYEWLESYNAHHPDNPL